jgi:hypothetical protein
VVFGQVRTTYWRGPGTYNIPSEANRGGLGDFPQERRLLIQRNIRPPSR